ncbi:MAG: hypothetical protein LBD09_04960, partial [Treponema sp.]|nr:hypothetical protein [Treponema sp.]
MKHLTGAGLVPPALILALILVFALALPGCSRKTETPDASGKKEFRIGIAKIVQHEALDATEQGIQDALRARGINAIFDLQNANGDPNTAAQIANKFKSGKVDLAIGIATPTAVALANAIKDAPVVFSVVTDPVDARLVSSLDRG